jgi:hypothetical protein
MYFKHVYVLICNMYCCMCVLTVMYFSMILTFNVRVHVYVLICNMYMYRVFTVMYVSVIQNGGLPEIQIL